VASSEVPTPNPQVARVDNRLPISGAPPPARLSGASLHICEPVHKITRLGSTASQVVRLIGLLLIFASQKIVHKVRNEMAESIVPFRKKIKDSLTRQGMWKIRGLHRKALLAEREEKERVLSSERAHKQVLTAKKNMHLILNSSIRKLVTVAISTAPDEGFHHESMSSQAKPAHIPHNMLREVKVHTDSEEASGGHPHSAPVCVNQLEDLRGGRQTKND